MSKLQVLVVDDEPLVGKRLKSILTKVGCDVETFDRPEEAFLRLHERRFDVIVSDIVMAELDGLQLLEYLMGRCSKSKVIMITGYANMETAKRAREKGAFEFLAKPFKPDDLRRAVARAAAELGIEVSMPAAAADAEEAEQ